MIEALKLYFFYSTANRDAFLLSKAEALDKAATAWATLSGDLAGAKRRVGGGRPAGRGELAAAHWLTDRLTVHFRG